MKKNYRADELLCARGHCMSKEEAVILIMEGKVRVNKDDVVKNPSRMLPAESPLLVETGDEFVSRGAHKLKNALERISPDLTGKVCADIGASTGGFTHLMLTKNAAKVFAVDVGKGLLHWKLRQDERVVVLEGVNGKNISLEITGEKADILTMDVSFISTTKILAGADSILEEGALAYILVKPQFEAPREKVPPGGVITDENTRQEALQKVCNFVKENLPWELVEVTDSPLKGPKGNLEFVAVFRKKSAI